MNRQFLNPSVPFLAVCASATAVTAILFGIAWRPDLIPGDAAFAAVSSLPFDASNAGHLQSITFLFGALFTILTALASEALRHRRIKKWTSE